MRHEQEEIYNKDEHIESPDDFSGVGNGYPWRLGNGLHNQQYYAQNNAGKGY